jgi:predicted transcriptional regulator
MRATVTVSLPAKLKKELDREARAEGSSRSDIVRRSVERYLTVRRFDAVTARASAEARAKGIFTEEDVLRRLGDSRCGSSSKPTCSYRHC